MAGRNFTYIDFTKDWVSNPLNVADNTAATAINDQVDYFWTRTGAYLEMAQNLASTAGVAIVSYIPSTTGLLIASDGAAEGVEFTEGITSGRMYHSFVVGTSPAFFAQATFKTTTLANSLAYMVGFRKLGAYELAFSDAASLLTAYDEAAMLGCTIADGTVKSHFSKAGADTATSATHAVIATATWVCFRVDVSSAGVVSYKVGSSLASQAAAEAALAADTALAVPSQSLTAATEVVPIIAHIGTVSGVGDLRLLKYVCGLA